MKCPQCTANHQRKAGMRCACGYQFTFDPKTDGISDGKFLSAVRLASGNDTYYFTINQLHTALCRKFHSPIGWLVILGVLCVTSPCHLGLLYPGFMLMAPLGLVLMIAAAVNYFQNRWHSFQTTEKRLKRWLADNKSIEKYLFAAQLQQPPPEWKEADIYAYGCERILLVQHDLLVDLFVKNGFHTQHRALVMSMSGYPHYLQPVAEKALQENPQLPILLLHDSTLDGLEMPVRLPTRAAWLPVGEHPVIDLGITPEDVKRLKQLRPTNPGGRNYEIPVDCLLYASLAQKVGVAGEQQTPMTELLAEPEFEIGGWRFTSSSDSSFG